MPAVWVVGWGLGAGGGVRADPPALLLPPATTGNTTPALPTLSAQRDLEYEANGQVIIARENAKLETPTMRVEADLIKFNKSSGDAEADGAVAITQKALRVLAQKAAYDAQKQAIAVDLLRLGKPPLYLEGQTLTGNASTALIGNATLYFNEPDAYGLNMHASNVTYAAANQELTLHDATMRIGSVPFFYLPSFTQERTDHPPVSVQTRFGYQSNLGAYGQTTTFWTTNPQFQPGLLLDYYGNRGALAGPALKYDYLQNPDWLQSGTLESGYIDDWGNRGTDLLGQPVPQDRYFVDWQHKGTLDGEVDLTSSLYWWSDSNVLRDFRQGQWQDNQLPDNFVEAVHREDNFLVSVFTRYDPNNFSVVQERQPETRLDLLPTPLGPTGIFEEGQASYVQLDEPSLSGAPTLRSNRFDAYYGWRRPFTPTNWLTITPVAGGRITDYQDTLDGQGEFTRLLGQAGFDAELRSYGLWEYDNSIWDIHDLRHVLRPVLQYRYIPNAQEGQGEIPAIDHDVFSSDPPMLDLDNTRSVDQLYSMDLVRYGFENLLQTRAEGYGSRDLLAFNVYNDALIQRGPGQSAFSNLWTALGLYPADWLHADIFTRFDPDALTLRETRARIRLIDGEKWAVALYTDNLQHQIDQYWVDTSYRLSERYELSARWRFDQRLGYLTEQTYGLKTRLGNSWDITYEISYLRGTNSENGIGFNVRVNLLSF